LFLAVRDRQLHPKNLGIIAHHKQLFLAPLWYSLKELVIRIHHKQLFLALRFRLPHLKNLAISNLLKP
jgi:hypothetical protein